jgi:uncharacterized protein (TIRG00374 family)
LGSQKKTRDRLLNILKIAVSVVGLLLIVLTQDLGQAFRALVKMDWLPFLGALLLLLSGSLVRAYRWGCLVWALGVRVSWWRLVRLYFVGAFFSQFLPTGVGGDAVKMYELSRDDHRAAAAISSVLVDRFLGLFILFAMASLALISSYELVEPGVRLLIAALCAGSLIGAALLLQRHWIEAWGQRLRLDRLLGGIKLLRELYESVHLYGTAALVKATVASVIWNLILILGYYLLGLAVGIDLALRHYFLLVPIISAVLLVPSVGGLGVRENTTVLLLRRVGVDEPQALALALAYDITLWITALIGAAIYFIQGMLEARQ